MTIPTLPTSFPPKLDYQNQCVVVPGTKKPGQTAHYRNGAFPFVTVNSPDALKTLHDVWECGLRRGANEDCLGHRPIISSNPLKFGDQFVWQSWATIDARKRALGSGLLKLFEDGVIGGGDLRTIGVWSKNCPNWQVVDLATHAYGLVGVSLYDTLGHDAVEFIVNHAETSIIFASSQHLPTVLKLSARSPIIKAIVSIEDLSPDSKRILGVWGQERNIKVFDFHEIEELGKANLKPLPAVTSDTIATICYTSGTTGNPKGVVLTHGNLANTVHSCLLGFEIEEKVTELSYLPLAHIYERVQELCVLASGGRIGFGTGDPLRLLEDLQTLKPNYIPSVPRVLNRIYQSGMAAGSAPGLKGVLFNRALQAKLQRLHTTGECKHAFWDRLVFSKIQAVLGGKLKLVTCGSAPISGPAMEFLRVALACDIVEANISYVGSYGMTENCGTATRIWPNDPTSAGRVGGPQANTEIKLLDVPAMGYSSEDKPFPRGEICTRGDHCFKEYYKDEKNTKSTVDEDGWVHTGDVGEIDECGRLRIIDRVKNIMKLAQGEYVAIERVEGLYSASPVVAQLFVYGDSLQSYLLAVVVPDPAQLATIASRALGKRVTPEDIQALEDAVRDPKVNDRILKELGKEAKKAELKGFEMIKKIHVSLEPFTVENGCLTPTLKIRRKDAYNKFKAELDALYADTSAAPSASEL